MSPRSEEDLGRDLRAVYLADPPGPEFTGRVLEHTHREAAPDREISVRLRPRRGGLAVAIAAAAVLLVLVGSRAFTPGSEESPDPAPDPTAVTGGGPDHLTVEIREGGGIWFRGRERTAVGVREQLRAEVAAKGAGRPELYVVLRAAKSVEWRRVQEVMQACADPGVRLYKIRFAAERDVGEEAASPLRPVPAADVTVALRRAEGDGETSVRLLDRDLGAGAAAFARLARELDAIGGGHPAVLRAAPAVPHRDVLRALDTLMGAGIRDITFVGAPPRR